MMVSVSCSDVLRIVCSTEALPLVSTSFNQEKGAVSERVALRFPLMSVSLLWAPGPTPRSVSYTHLTLPTKRIV